MTARFLCAGYFILLALTISLSLGSGDSQAQDNLSQRVCPDDPSQNRYTLKAMYMNTRQLPSMDERMSALDRYEQCGVLDILSGYVDRKYPRQHGLRTAIFLVKTVNRGLTSEQPSHTLNRFKLVAFRARDMWMSDQQAMLAYAARKLAITPETEPLLALVGRPLPGDVVSNIAAAVTTRVPAGRWAPPGNQPIPFYVGNEAHGAIASHYEAVHTAENVAFNTTPISAVLQELSIRGIGSMENVDAKAIGDHAMRPDIMNLTTREIYEIKPVGAESVAAALVARHVKTFARAGVEMTPGRMNAAGTTGVVSGPAGHYTFYSPMPGVIVYQYRRGEYLPVKGTETAEQSQEGLAPVPVKEYSLVPARVPARKSKPRGFWDRMAVATGLTGTWLTIYVVVSEGSRVVFPPRNLVPVP